MCTGAQLANDAGAIVGVLLLGIVIGGIVVGMARAAASYRGSGRPD